jgi:Uma2 family endonuclease
MPVRTLMTAEQFDALPEEEGRKWELLDGELIEVSRHDTQTQSYSGKTLQNAQYFTRLRPDFGFFSAEKWRTVDLEKVPVVQTPDIAVEILSPSETATKINRKVDADLNGAFAKSG